MNSLALQGVRAMSVLELVGITAVAGLVLTICVQVLARLEATIREVSAYRNATDAGSTASRLLIEEILRAGYAGNALLTSGGITLYQSKQIKTANLPGAIRRHASTGSSVLGVRYATGNAVSANLLDSNRLLAVRRLETGANYLLVTGNASRILRIERLEATRTKGYLYAFSPALNTPQESEETALLALTEHYWYVRKTARFSGNAATFALYRFRNGRSAEISPGVRAMEVRINAGAVMLGLLLESETIASGAPDHQDYRLIEQEVVPAKQGVVNHDGLDRQRFVLRTAVDRGL